MPHTTPPSCSPALPRKLVRRVREGRERLHLEHSNIRRAIYPQEFVLVASHMHQFELVGWWNDWDFNQPLDSVTHGIVRPIIVLRRKLVRPNSL